MAATILANNNRRSKKETQNDMLLRYLKTGRNITPLEALMKFGIFRLSARIWDLREQGYQIDQEMVKINGKRVARYWLGERY